MMRSLPGSGAVAVRPPRHSRAAGSPQQQGQGPQGHPKHPPRALHRHERLLNWDGQASRRIMSRVIAKRMKASDESSLRS